MSRVAVKAAHGVAPRLYEATCDACNYFELGLQEVLLIEADHHARTCPPSYAQWTPEAQQRLSDLVFREQP